MERARYNRSKFQIAKESLQRFCKDLESRLLYKSAHFLDSNFLIKKNDARVRIFGKKKFFVTEYVFDEITKKESEWQEFLKPNHLQVINFDDVRRTFPATCPVYFNFVKSMYNPANICSSDFIINKNFALKEKGKLSEDGKNLNQILISRFYNGNANKFNKFGKEKNDWENYLNSSFLNRIKKRHSKKNKKERFFNDYRNLSLILIYTLLHRRNTYYYTSDIDIFCDLFSWFDSMAHQITLKRMLLDAMKETGGKGDILKRKKLVYYLGYNQFKKECEGMLASFLLDDRKKHRFNLYIRYWDPKKEKFFNEIRFSFDEAIRYLLLNNQGLMLCPFAANNADGNFFRYLYFWPPNTVHDLDTIKVSVQAKRFIHASNSSPPKEVHDLHCRYKRVENNNDSDFLESFRIGG